MQLVDDVLVQVFEHLSEMTGWSGRTLQALRLTCKRFDRLARPILLRYLELDSDNLDTVLAHLASPSSSRRVRGIRFLDLGRERGENGNPKTGAGPLVLGQSVAAEVLRSHPHLEELNFAMFAGTSVDPCLAAALRETTGSVKRLTISVSAPLEIIMEAIMDQILVSLHPSARLDVLYLAGSTSRAAIWLGRQVGVPLRSLVADSSPVVELGSSWQRLLESRRPRVVDLPSLDSVTRGHPFSPGVLADVEALSVTRSRYSRLFETFARLGPLPDGSPRSPKLRVITCEANWALGALCGVVDGSRADPFFRQVTTLVIFRAVGPGHPVITFSSVAGLPRLNRIITVGTCTVQVADASADVAIEKVEYPRPAAKESFRRVDLLWLLDTGEVRFLPR